jgi:hypothetical protein
MASAVVMGWFLSVLIFHPVWWWKIVRALIDYQRRYGIPAFPLDEGRKEHMAAFLCERGLIREEDGRLLPPWEAKNHENHSGRGSRRRTEHPRGRW